MEPGGSQPSWRLTSRTSLCLLALILVLRLGYTAAFLLNPAWGYPTWSMIGGVPWGDARAWDESAAELAAGRPVPEFWSARRPGYAYLLGAVYAWTGPSFAVALWLNCLASAVGAWLAAAVVARACSARVGCATALWLAVDPSSLAQSTEIMTEPVGLVFLMLHLIALGDPRKASAGQLGLSGLWLALSNSFRPLTLLALPGEMLLVAWSRGCGRRHARHSVAMLALGAALVLVPLAVLQRAQHGIWSLSDNTAEHFLAASTRQFGGTWSPEIYLLAAEAGKHTVRERYQYFQQLAWRNLRQEPAVFVENVARSLAYNVRGVGGAAIAFPLGLAALVLAAGLLWRSGSERRKPGLLGWGPPAAGAVVALVAAGGLEQFVDDSWGWAVVILAAIVGLRQAWPRSVRTGSRSERDGALPGVDSQAAEPEVAALGPRLVLVTLLVASLAALALMVTRESRHWSYLTWIGVALVLGMVDQLARKVQEWFGILLGQGWAETEPTAELPRREASREPVAFGPSLGSLALLGAVLLALGISAGRLVWLRRHPPLDPTRATDFRYDQHQVRLLTDRVARWWPALAPALQATSGVPHPPGSAETRGASAQNLVVLGMFPRRYQYFLPAGGSASQLPQAFGRRDYDRTIFVAVAVDGSGGLWEALVCWPGRFPGQWTNQPLACLGTVSAPFGSGHPLVIDAAALVPLDPTKRAWRWDQARLAAVPAHRQAIYRRLAPGAAAPSTEPGPVQGDGAQPLGATGAFSTPAKLRAAGG